MNDDAREIAQKRRLPFLMTIAGVALFGVGVGTGLLVSRYVLYRSTPTPFYVNPPVDGDDQDRSDIEGRYKVSGDFTREATPDDIDEVRAIARAEGGRAGIMESFPLKFQINNLSFEACERIHAELSALSSIRRMSACVMQVSVENPDATIRSPITKLSGIYAVLPINDTSQFSLAEVREILQNPSVSGIALRERWIHLEPQEGTYDFTRIDSVLAEATSANKAVQLILVPGLYSPDWLLRKIDSCDNFASTNCGKITTNVPYGPGHGNTSELPLVWDPTYKQAWLSFMSEVARRYNNNARVVSIAITGATSVSAEMSMPEEDNIEKWNRMLGLFYPKDDPHYSSNLIFVEEWQNAIKNYARIFQGKTLVLTMGSGLVNFQKGAPREAKDQIVSFFQRVDSGSNAKGVQTSGMKACRNNEGGIGAIKTLTSGGIKGGGQFNSSVSNNPESMGCTDANVCGRNEKTFCRTNPSHNCCSLKETQALQNVLGVYFDQTPYGSAYGTNNGPFTMTYLQIYKDDILFANTSPDFNHVLKEAGDRIKMMAE